MAESSVCAGQSLRDVWLKVKIFPRNNRLLRGDIGGLGCLRRFPSFQGTCSNPNDIMHH
jgi:hypothetical protein